MSVAIVVYLKPLPSETLQHPQKTYKQEPLIICLLHELYKFRFPSPWLTMELAAPLPSVYTFSTFPETDVLQ